MTPIRPRVSFLGQLLRIPRGVSFGGRSTSWIFFLRNSAEKNLLAGGPKMRPKQTCFFGGGRASNLPTWKMVKNQKSSNNQPLLGHFHSFGGLFFQVGLLGSCWNYPEGVICWGKWGSSLLSKSEAYVYIYFISGYSLLCLTFRSQCSPLIGRHV